MDTINSIIDSLERTPKILEALLDHIPMKMYTKVRLADKWTIHEQVCHLIHAQGILINRFVLFEGEDVKISNHDPNSDNPKDFYANMNMLELLKSFPSIRRDLTEQLRAYPTSYWEKEGVHSSYIKYNPKILVGHCLNVDYTHLFSIEQLGLIKEEFTQEIMVLP